jgi:hypothetical protein
LKFGGECGSATRVGQAVEIENDNLRSGPDHGVTIPTMFKSAMDEGHDVADEPFELESEDPPAEYCVVAVPEEQSANWQDPKRLSELAPHAARDAGITGTMNGVTFHYYAVPSYRTLLAEHGFTLVDVHDDRGVSTYFLAHKLR